MGRTWAYVGSYYGYIASHYAGEAYFDNIGSQDVSFIFKAASSAKTKYGQRFYCTRNASLNKCFAYLSKVGTPAGNVRANIYSDSGGLPNTLLGSSGWISCNPTDPSSWYYIPTWTSHDFTRFDFSPTIAITSGSYYHLVLETDDTYKASFADGVTEIVWGSDASSPTYGYAASEYSVDSGWSTRADVCFLFNVHETYTGHLWDNNQASYDGSRWTFPLFESCNSATLCTVRFCAPLSFFTKSRYYTYIVGVIGI